MKKLEASEANKNCLLYVLSSRIDMIKVVEEATSA